MFNDGGKGSGTSEDLAIEERMRIATEGIIVVDMEVFDGQLPMAQGGGDDEREQGEEGAAEGEEGGEGAPAPARRNRFGFMTGRARVTSRSMWTDEVGGCRYKFNSVDT
jgi:hypothetical protein